MHASYSAAPFSCLEPFETSQQLVSDTRNDPISYDDSDSGEGILTCFLDQLARLRVRATVLMLTFPSYSYQIYLSTSSRYAVVDPQEN